MFVVGCYQKNPNFEDSSRHPDDVWNSNVQFILDTIQVYETEREARKSLELSMRAYADDVIRGVLGHHGYYAQKVHDDLAEAARRIGQGSETFPNNLWEVEVDEGYGPGKEMPHVWYIHIPE